MIKNIVFDMGNVLVRFDPELFMDRYSLTGEDRKLMDGALISAEVKLLKPDPQIYRTFLRKFGLRPEECVFIDDTPINVEGALYENMAGIVFNMDVAALAESLRSLGVEW